jgi:hypothetical protein
MKFQSAWQLEILLLKEPPEAELRMIEHLALPFRFLATQNLAVMPLTYHMPKDIDLPLVLSVWVNRIRIEKEGKPFDFPARQQLETIGFCQFKIINNKLKCKI